jgi:hypothetical protein
MIVCPVCEHQQAPAAECAVCGKPLVVQAVPEPPPKRMTELEVTRFSAGAVRSTPLAELESTRIAVGPALPAVPLPEIDLGRAPAGDVRVAPMGDLETGRFVDPSERTPFPAGAVTCRYCRNVQSEGMLCDRCGMRLPRYVAPAVESGAASAEDAPRVRHACGSMTRAGMLCSTCGVHVPLPSE